MNTSTVFLSSLALKHLTDGTPSISAIPTLETFSSRLSPPQWACHAQNICLGMWPCQPCRINTTMSCITTPAPRWGFISSCTSPSLMGNSKHWASFSAYLLNLLIDWTSWSCLLMGSSASSQGLGCTGGLKEQAAKITTESHLGIKKIQFWF